MELTVKLILTRKTIAMSLFVAMVATVSGVMVVRYMGSDSILPVIPVIFGALLGGLAPSVTWLHSQNGAAQLDDATDRATPDR